MSTLMEHWLKMRVHPVAVKMLKNEKDVPENTIVPTRDWGHRFSQCQALAKSQREGLTIAMFKEDSWCPEPVVGYGFANRTPLFLAGRHRFPDTIKELSAASKWCENMPYFAYGKYKGILSGPANKCNFMPDLIMMHVNGMMASQLLIVKNWLDGRDIHCQLSGHAVCVYAVVPPLLNRDCYIAIPCRGEKRVAGAQDDEIVFSMPIKFLSGFIEGIRFFKSKNSGIPIPQLYKEEYDLKPSYKDLGDTLGMDMRKSFSK